MSGSTPPVPPTRKGGRPRKDPAAPPTKRKAVDELSTNPASVARRNRLERLTPMEREVELAVNRDRARRWLALGRYRKEDAYKALSDEQKAEAEELFKRDWNLKK